VKRLGIIFMHYRDDPVTRFHFDLVKKLHPDDLLVPVSGGDYGIPGSIMLKQLPGEMGDLWRRVTNRGTSVPAWRHVDVGYYAAWDACREDIERWVFLEWDIRCNMSVRDFFAPNWDDQIVCADVRRTDDWWWGMEADRLPEVLRPHACGCVICTCMMLTDEALFRVVEAFMGLPFFNTFCELRLGTLASYAGCQPTKLSRVAGAISPDPLGPEVDLSRPGLFHAVKNLARK